MGKKLWYALGGIGLVACGYGLKTLIDSLDEDDYYASISDSPYLDSEDLDSDEEFEVTESQNSESASLDSEVIDSEIIESTDSKTA